MPADADESVTISGTVTDPRGKPLPGLQVVLTASRRFFSLSHFRVRERGAKRVYATTGSEGEYTLRWTLNESYNSFKLAVAVPAEGGDSSELTIIKEVDLSRRMADHGTVAASLVVEGLSSQSPRATRPSEPGLQGGSAGDRSADQRRVALEEGEPDRVRSSRFPRQTEVTWWYFERGKVYRFEDGVLRDVIQFAPVKDF